MDLKLEAKDFHNIQFKADGRPFWETVAERVNQVIEKKLAGAPKVQGREVGSPNTRQEWLWSDHDAFLADCTHEALLVNIREVRK